MRSWSNPYIGIPWREKGRDVTGLDCWGLVALAFLEVHDIRLPDYSEDYLTTADIEELDRLFQDTQAPPWQPLGTRLEKGFDIVTFRRAGLMTHIGLLVEPGRMLHIEQGGESHVASFTDGRWRPRLAGLFRHEALA